MIRLAENSICNDKLLPFDQIVKVNRHKLEDGKLIPEQKLKGTTVVLHVARTELSDIPEVAKAEGWKETTHFFTWTPGSTKDYILSDSSKNNTGNTASVKINHPDGTQVRLNTAKGISFSGRFSFSGDVCLTPSLVAAEI